MNPILLQAADTGGNVTTGTAEVSLWTLVAGENGESLFIMVPLMLMSVVVDAAVGLWHCPTWLRASCRPVTVPLFVASPVVSRDRLR